MGAWVGVDRMRLFCGVGSKGWLGVRGSWEGERRGGDYMLLYVGDALPPFTKAMKIYIHFVSSLYTHLKELRDAVNE